MVFRCEWDAENHVITDYPLANIICSFTTLFTSIWTILILLSTAALKLLAPIHQFTAWFFDVVTLSRQGHRDRRRSIGNDRTMGSAAHLGRRLGHLRGLRLGTIGRALASRSSSMTRRASCRTAFGPS